jgi:hypothetical protein
VPNHQRERFLRAWRGIDESEQREQKRQCGRETHPEVAVRLNVCMMRSRAELRASGSGGDDGLATRSGWRRDRLSIRFLGGRCTQCTDGYFVSRFGSAAQESVMQFKLLAWQSRVKIKSKSQNTIVEFIETPSIPPSGSGLRCCRRKSE